MRGKKSYTFFLLSYLLAVSSCLVSQNKHRIDSLTVLLNTTTVDTTRIILCNTLSNAWKPLDLKKAVKYAEQGYAYSEKRKSKPGMAMLLNTLGSVYYNHDNNKALDYYQRAYKLFLEIGNKEGASTSLNNIGALYTSTGDYKNAAHYIIEGLKIKEALGDKSDIARSYHNLGALQTYMGNYREAINTTFKSIRLKEEIDTEDGIAGDYGNIGTCYYNLGIQDSSIYFNMKALAIREKQNEKNGIALSYNNLAASWSEKGDLRKALEYILLAKKIYEETDDQMGLALSYNNAGDLYRGLKDYKRSLEFSLKSLEIAKMAGSKDDIMSSLNSIAETYSLLGDYKSAFDYYKKYSAVRDSIYNEENSKQISEIQTKFETEKKESQIKLLNKDKELQTKEIEDHKTTRKYLIAVISLIVLFSFFVARAYRQKRKDNVLITLQKSEVENQKILVEEKNHLVEEKNKEILDSIHYAKRIQQALLTSDSYIAKHVPEVFILYKPKDIVSGDFYWALSIQDTEKHTKFFIATADCTGHGVPGAFMSMLGISFLNEIVLERKISNPALALDVMREEIIRILNPEGSTEESKDGMDCVLCAYDLEKMELNFAAANNPLWLVRKGELTEYKADKMPVGKYGDIVDSFTKQTIHLEKGDVIYTFTDGFADQFGGPKGKKFKYKQLQQLLLANFDKPLEEQKKLLNDAIENWRGKLEQVDDILLIGIQI
ncbi:MAG: tetratricopeptide repeat protein [Bacteroidia bacterium]